MGKIKKVICYSGATLIFAAGIFFGYKMMNNEIDNVNNSEESIVLYNTNKIFNSRFSEKKLAYLIADNYLYNAKNIRINTLKNNLDPATFAGLVTIENIIDNCLIKDISKYEDGAFVTLEPNSQEYINIVNQRAELANALTSKTVFNQTSNQEMVDFSNFIINNFDTSLKEWGGIHTFGMVAFSLIGALFALGYVSFVEGIDEYHY